MARRPRQPQDEGGPPAAVERHITALGLDSWRQYFDWCWANGFDQSFDKSRNDLQEERDAHAAILARREKQSRLHRNPQAFLKEVCEGRLSSDDIDRPTFKQVAVEIEASKEAAGGRDSLLEMLLAVMDRCDLVFSTTAERDAVPHVRGLIRMHDRKALWLRPLADWKPKSKNADRMFGELARHLFDKYGDVPRFMDRVWLRNDRPSWRFRDWYVHLGRGHNLRTAKAAVPLTKKMAHFFLSAPEDFTVEQAVRWGQLSALGATEKAIKAVAATRLGRSFVNEEFWFTVLRFIADNPMLDHRQIGPIVDYLQTQRFENIEVEVRPGVLRSDPPPQPRLSMHGRTVETLLRQVHEWHGSLGKQKLLSAEAYVAAPFDGLSMEQSRGKSSRRWTIRQLRSARDLQTEGDALRHCVASYHWSCARGRCTIWSLSMAEGEDPLERRQTIEVDSGKIIVQCRGLANRGPSGEEWAIVQRWASEAGLRIAVYVN